MGTQLHQVDLDLCSGDGLCAEICPEDVLAMIHGKAATDLERADNCIECAQCVAVCPTGSLKMPMFPDTDFADLRRPSLGYDEFYDLLRTRRSVRAFKDRPVEPEMVDRILQAAATAPMGMPPHSTGVTVVDRRAELDYLLEQLVHEYDKTIKAMSSPIGRMIMRVAAGPTNYRVVRDTIGDLARHANDLYRRDGSDRYLYRAPLLLLFHGDRSAMSYEENAHLVCTHAMLAAQALGLGTTIIGMVPPVVDRSKLLRERYRIPKEHRVLTSIIAGYPKYKYRKSIRRDLAGVSRV